MRPYSFPSVAVRGQSATDETVSIGRNCDRPYKPYLIFAGSVRVRPHEPGATRAGEMPLALDTGQRPVRILGIEVPRERIDAAQRVRSELLPQSLSDPQVGVRPQATLLTIHIAFEHTRPVGVVGAADTCPDGARIVGQAGDFRFIRNERARGLKNVDMPTPLGVVSKALQTGRGSSQTGQITPFPS